MYLNHTQDQTLCLKPTQSSSPTTWEITAFSDADYADHSDSSASTNGATLFLNGSLVAWESKKQKSTSRSTTESEYVSASNTARRIQVIRIF